MGEAAAAQQGASSTNTNTYTGPAAGSGDSDRQSQPPQQRYPPGIVLDKDGKPCRTCTSWKQWAAMKRKEINSPDSPSKQQQQQQHSSTVIDGQLKQQPQSQPQPQPPDDCPPDVEQLGRATWTFLHSVTAAWPEKATAQQQKDMVKFLETFGRVYPCWVCAEDFRTWMAKEENRIIIGHDDDGRRKKNYDKGGNGERRFLSTRDEFGKWMCRAHNAVNVKLGKPEFDCRLWEERWRKGWPDGRCD